MSLTKTLPIKIAEALRKHLRDDAEIAGECKAGIEFVSNLEALATGGRLKPVFLGISFAGMNQVPISGGAYQIDTLLDLGLFTFPNRVDSELYRATLAMRIASRLLGPHDRDKKAGDGVLFDESDTRLTDSAPTVQSIDRPQAVGNLERMDFRVLYTGESTYRIEDLD